MEFLGQKSKKNGQIIPLTFFRGSVMTALCILLLPLSTRGNKYIIKSCDTCTTPSHYLVGNTSKPPTNFTSRHGKLPVVEASCNMNGIYPNAKHSPIRKYIRQRSRARNEAKSATASSTE